MLGMSGGAPVALAYAHAHPDRWNASFLALIRAGWQRPDSMFRWVVCPVCFNAKALDPGEPVPNAQLGGTVPMWQWIGDETVLVAGGHRCCATRGNGRPDHPRMSSLFTAEPVSSRSEIPHATSPADPTCRGNRAVAERAE